MTNRNGDKPTLTLKALCDIVEAGKRLDVELDPHESIRFRENMRILCENNPRRDEFRKTLVKLIRAVELLGATQISRLNLK